MSNGTQDEFAAWGRLLRQPDALPHEGLADKDAAWDKLFDRLGEKPRRPSYGYYIAAACILIFLVPATHLFQTRQVSERQPFAIPRGMRPPAIAPLAAKPLTAKSAIPAPLSRQSTPASPRPAPPAHPAVGLRPTTIQPAIYGQKNTQPEIAQTVPIPIRPDPPAPDLPPVSAHPPQGQTPTAKKQWKVVDLNELDPGRQRPHVMATNRKPLVLRIGLGPGNKGTDPGTAATPSDDDNPLKINLTTQNR